MSSKLNDSITPGHIRSLLERLVAEARSRGLSQARLAAQAGLSPVGLSKAKRRGDIRASTLERLAEQLDMELALVPRRSREQALRAVRAGTLFRRSGEAAAAPGDEE